MNPKTIYPIYRGLFALPVLPFLAVYFNTTVLENPYTLVPTNVTFVFSFPLLLIRLSAALLSFRVSDLLDPPFTTTVADFEYVRLARITPDAIVLRTLQVF